MAITVKVTETYDLKTTKNKLGIIGIHTPNMNLVYSLYPGLCKQYKFVRFKKCNIYGACASVLPADPLQVGVESGTVAPEDMFNPLLYKAVSNESFDSIVSRIYDSVNTSDVNEHGSVNDQVLDVSTDNAFKAYYALLAEQRTWRKSMPQTGFSIRGLYPIAHTLLSNYGNVEKPHTELIENASDQYDMVPDNLGNVPFAVPAFNAMNTSGLTANGLVFKGRPVRMPKFPLHYSLESVSASSTPETVPKTFVACMIVPPARLHEFYYRMRVTWTVQFIELCSTLQYGNIADYGYVANRSYASNYTQPSSKLDTESSTVDADNVDVTKIMES